MLARKRVHRGLLKIAPGTTRYATLTHVKPVCSLQCGKELSGFHQLDRLDLAREVKPLGLGAAELA